VISACKTFPLLSIRQLCQCCKQFPFDEKVQGQDKASFLEKTQVGFSSQKKFKFRQAAAIKKLNRFHFKKAVWFKKLIFFLKKICLPNINFTVLNIYKLGFLYCLSSGL